MLNCYKRFDIINKNNVLSGGLDLKKILAILVGLIFFFGVITGCSGNNKTAQNTESNSSSVTASVISVEDVNYLDANGESVYRIVRP